MFTLLSEWKSFTLLSESVYFFDISTSWQSLSHSLHTRDASSASLLHSGCGVLYPELYIVLYCCSVVLYTNNSLSHVNIGCVVVTLPRLCSTYPEAGECISLYRYKEMAFANGNLCKIPLFSQVLAIFLPR